VLGARVHPQRPPAVLVGTADRQLQHDGAVARQDERGRERQLLDPVAAGRVGGPDGEFQERGAGEQDRAHDLVVGQPWMVADAEPAGEQVTESAGQCDRRAEQRMSGVGETGGGDVAGPVRRHLGPVVLVLERVGG
jgi:hypothetical protein